MTARGALLAFLLALLLSITACSRGKDDAETPPAAASTATLAATELAQAAATASATPEPTPAATPTPGPPTPTPTPAPRDVNGLMVVDEVWVGIVREPGGLRIRSAPRLEPGNVVGSVAEGTPVNVEGRVLNGQEAETGKGTVWLIVGPSQYIYAAQGYVERVR